jgi:hypothetical protein
MKGDSMITPTPIAAGDTVTWREPIRGTRQTAYTIRTGTVIAIYGGMLAIVKCRDDEPSISVGLDKLTRIEGEPSTLCRAVDGDFSGEAR